MIYLSMVLWPALSIQSQDHLLKFAGQNTQLGSSASTKTFALFALDTANSLTMLNVVVLLQMLSKPVYKISKAWQSEMKQSSEFGWTCDSEGHN